MMIRALALGALLLLSASSATCAELTVACGSGGAMVESCRSLTKEWAKRTGHTVRLYITPPSTTEQLKLFNNQFKTKSTEIDVITLDVIWPAALAEHLLDLGPYAKAVRSQHFPSMVANNVVNGKLVAVPWFTEVGMLFYRKDLLAKYKLAVPDTWEALTAAAAKIQQGEQRAGNGGMHGFIFQTKAYEGLTCNALEWIASYGGGTLIDAKGKITLNNPKAARALDMAAGWQRSIAPADLPNLSEEGAISAFARGNAAFMRNWTYAWPLTQRADSKVNGKIGVVPLPKGPGGAGISTLGGWQIAVSRYSANAALAADLAMFLTSPESQKMRALELGTLPTYPALYRDPDILKAVPYLETARVALETAVQRPNAVTGKKYSAVSAAVADSTRKVLAGQLTGKEAVTQMERELEQIRGGPNWSTP